MNMNWQAITPLLYCLHIWSLPHETFIIHFGSTVVIRSLQNHDAPFLNTSMHGYSVCCLYCRVHVHGTNLVEPENKLVYSLRHLRKIESALLFDNILKRNLNDIIYLTWNIYSAKGKANAEKIQTTDIWELLYAVLLTIKQK